MVEIKEKIKSGEIKYFNPVTNSNLDYWDDKNLKIKINSEYDQGSTNWVLVTSMHVTCTQRCFHAHETTCT